ncbi:MAG: hypothetical protein LUF92_03355 [Clostridiales bacterium]|nr:hypothetical protein [Clostridiales bacterium]
MNSNTTKKKTYYAFFDAEYTCYMESDAYFDREHGGELISVGLVISDRNFNLQKKYYSVIHPIYNPKLTGYCKRLTGLTQEEIDKAPSYDEVFQEMYLLLQEYPVKEIFTWGNDSNTLTHDIERNHKSVARRHKRIVSLLRDITKRLTKRVFDKGMTVSLSDMKYICDLDHFTAHNALEDAEDLYRITKCCVQGTYNSTKAKQLQDYIQRRDTYHQYRRFKKPFQIADSVDYDDKNSSNPDRTAGKKKKNKNGGRSGAFQDISFQYIEMLKNQYRDIKGDVPTEILAMCDDVRSLAGKEGVECPKLE